MGAAEPVVVWGQLVLVDEHAVAEPEARRPGSAERKHGALARSGPLVSRTRTDSQPPAVGVRQLTLLIATTVAS